MNVNNVNPIFVKRYDNKTFLNILKVSDGTCADQIKTLGAHNLPPFLFVKGKKNMSRLNVHSRYLIEKD